MKNPIDEELYTFLTLESNFDYMCQLARQYGIIKRRLIVEFWDEVARNIEEWRQGKEWRLVTTDYFAMYANLSLTKNKWPSRPNTHEVAISWNGLSEATFYGLWTHANSTHIKVEEFCLEIQKLDVATKFPSQDQQWWPLQAKSGDDFGLDDHLKRILPDKMPSLAKSYADLICDFADEINDDLDRIMEKYKQ